MLADGTWSTTITLAGEVAHTIEVGHTDRAGNAGTPVQVVHVYDITPPAVDIATPGVLSVRLRRC